MSARPRHRTFAKPASTSPRVHAKCSETLDAPCRSALRTPSFGDRRAALRRLARIASGAVMELDSGSYSTSIAFSRLEGAACMLLAATAATAWPLVEGTFPLSHDVAVDIGEPGLALADIDQLVARRAGRSRSGHDREHAVHAPPQLRRYRPRESSRERAGFARIAPCSEPGSRTSAPYRARPVTLSVPSWRTGRVPTTSKVLVARTMLGS